MAIIASIIAVIVSLGALYLASSANKQAGTSFRDFTEHLIKQVKNAQDDLQKTVRDAHRDLNTTRRSVDDLDRMNEEFRIKIGTLEQRIHVLEHELKSLTEVLPAKYRDSLGEKRQKISKSA